MKQLYAKWDGRKAKDYYSRGKEALKEYKFHKTFCYYFAGAFFDVRSCYYRAFSGGD